MVKPRPTPTLQAFFERRNHFKFVFTCLSQSICSLIHQLATIHTQVVLLVFRAFIESILAGSPCLLPLTLCVYPVRVLFPLTCVCALSCVKVIHPAWFFKNWFYLTKEILIETKIYFLAEFSLRFFFLSSTFVSFLFKIVAITGSSPVTQLAAFVCACAPHSTRVCCVIVTHFIIWSFRSPKLSSPFSRCHSLVDIQK